MPSFVRTTSCAVRLFSHLVRFNPKSTVSMRFASKIRYEPHDVTHSHQRAYLRHQQQKMPSPTHTEENAAFPTLSRVSLRLSTNLISVGIICFSLDSLLAYVAGVLMMANAIFNFYVIYTVWIARNGSNC